MHETAPSSILKIAVAGAGRMGQALVQATDKHQDLTLAGVWQRDTDLGVLVQACDVLVDFSLPEGTEIAVAAATERGVPMVCGVSGLNDLQFAALRAASQSIPLLYDRNMSLGIAVIARAVSMAATSLGPGFDIEIAETHHVHKKDSPSGTALQLGAAILSTRRDLTAEALSYQSVRHGEVPGDHDVTLRSETESLTFSHSVTTRDVFVDGALRAARWIIGRRPGLYSMQDVLFDEPK